MNLRAPAVCLLLLVAGVVGACQDDDVGQPCTKDDQCGGMLVCTFQNGKSSCQAPVSEDDTGHGGTIEDTEHGNDSVEDTEHGGDANAVAE